MCYNRGCQKKKLLSVREGYPRGFTSMNRNALVRADHAKEKKGKQMALVLRELEEKALAKTKKNRDKKDSKHNKSERKAPVLSKKDSAGKKVERSPDNTEGKITAAVDGASRVDLSVDKTSLEELGSNLQRWMMARGVCLHAKKATVIAEVGGLIERDEMGMSHLRSCSE